LINGLIVIDKPAGITSHDVVSRLRRLFGTRRVGHTGTLDPFATGVLPVAVNDGTKVIPYLDEGIKGYDALMRLGVATDTLDITGQILQERDCDRIDLPALQSVLRQFMGRIDQIPPMYSAIKRDGQPLYKLARQGYDVERQPRSVEIFALEVLSLQLPFVGLRVSCSRGTYVRSLADDIGRALGCGATLQELRRTASGPFRLQNAITLESLAEVVAAGTVDHLVVSPSMALGHLLEIPLLDAGVRHIGYGRSPEWHDTQHGVAPEVTTPCLARLTRDGELLAVAELKPAGTGVVRLVLKRVFAAV